MQYEMSRLIRLTGWLAEQYTSKDTSSITYETAEMLMEAVLYCINEYEEPGEPGEHGDVSGEDDGVQAERVPASRTEPDAETAWRWGYQAVLGKVRRAGKIYEAVVDEFEDYGCQNYREAERR